MRRLLLLALLLATTAPVWAGNLYKQVDGEGRIVLQSNPNPKWKTLEVIPVAEPGPEEAAALRQRQVNEARDEAEAQARLDKRLAGQDAAYAELQAALEAFRAAETAREAGREPLPGERLGTRSGYSRLNAAYTARQQQLEATLETARQRLAAARQAWNEVR